MGRGVGVLGVGGGGKRMTQTVLHTPVDEVPQVVEQFAVVLQQQVVPAEAGVLASKDDAISTEVIKTLLSTLVKGTLPPFTLASFKCPR